MFADVNASKVQSTPDNFTVYKSRLRLVSDCSTPCDAGLLSTAFPCRQPKAVSKSGSPRYALAALPQDFKRRLARLVPRNQHAQRSGLVTCQQQLQLGRVVSRDGGLGQLQTLSPTILASHSPCATAPADACSGRAQDAQRQEGQGCRRPRAHGRYTSACNVVCARISPAFCRTADPCDCRLVCSRTAAAERAWCGPSVGHAAGSLGRYATCHATQRTRAFQPAQLLRLLFSQRLRRALRCRCRLAAPARRSLAVRTPFIAQSHDITKSRLPLFSANLLTGTGPAAAAAAPKTKGVKRVAVSPPTEAAEPAAKRARLAPKGDLDACCVASCPACSVGVRAAVTDALFLLWRLAENNPRASIARLAASSSRTRACR